MQILKNSLHHSPFISFLLSGEEGIDSGGLGKEAFLLISKEASIFVGSAYKNWMVCYGTDLQGYLKKKRHGDSLFFTEDVHVKKSGPTRVLTPGPCSIRKRSSISMLAPITAMNRRSSWRAASQNDGYKVITNNLAVGASMTSESNAITSGADSVTPKRNVLDIEQSANILSAEDGVTRGSFFKVQYIQLVQYVIY